MSSNSTAKNLYNLDLALGGQALIEGIMMRSPNYIVLALRSPSGELITKHQPFRSLTQKFKPLNLPLLRGIINFFEMMFIGTKALNFSASVNLESNEKQRKKSKFQKNSDFKTKLNNLERLTLTLSIISALILSLALFKFLPFWLTTFLSTLLKPLEYPIFFNIIDGILKISLFILYIFLISYFNDVKRLFMYHGAEHKTIKTHELNLPLNQNSIKSQTRFHPRCGTSFILLVFLISIFIFTFVPRVGDLWQDFSLRLFFLPIVAGISFEILKWSAKLSDQNKLFLFLTKPGLLLQRLTTKEPNPEMIEVAIAAIKKTLELENQTSKNSSN